MDTIVVGYDETAAAKRALERAIQIAKAFSAKLVVTSVAPVMEGAGRSMGPIDPVDPPERHHAELHEAATAIQAAGLAAELVPALGHPTDAIVQVANDHHADLIVVGTRGPGFVDRLLRQSTSQNVARHAHCDVLIVH
jgi:nucleotide-binding universal stress UspA family protein